MLGSAAWCRGSDSYGVADGDASGEASASVFFLVDDFFLVVVDFLLAGAAVDDFFVADAVVLVVVIDSFLLAHDDIKKPTATKATMEQIRDCFIGYG